MMIGIDMAARGMDGTGLLLVPAAAAFMLLAGLLAAADPARIRVRLARTVASAIHGGRRQSSRVYNRTSRGAAEREPNRTKPIS